MPPDPAAAAAERPSGLTARILEFGDELLEAVAYYAKLGVKVQRR